MKNVLFFFILFIFTFKNAKAQFNSNENSEFAVHKHNVMLSVGYAAPSIIRQYLKYKTTRDEITVSGVGPIVGKLEYMISDRFGIGVNAS